MRQTKYVKYMSDNFRAQRHDFMNYFQILYGYIQLGKINEANEYIKGIMELNKNMSKAYSISLLKVSILLDKMVREFSDIDCIVELDIKKYIDCTLRMVDNEDDIVNLLGKVFDYYMEREEFCKNKIHIKIEEFEDRISFLFVGKYNIAEILEETRGFNFEIVEEGTSFTFTYVNPIDILEEE